MSAMDRYEFRFDKELIDTIDRAARLMGLNRSSFVRLACTEKLAKIERENKADGATNAATTAKNTPTGEQINEHKH